MNKRQAQNAIDDLLEAAGITLTIEDIAQTILGGHPDDADDVISDQGNFARMAATVYPT